MINLAANLSMLFTEAPFESRFALAAKAGFKGVEYLFPYDHKPELLAELLQANGLKHVLFDLPAGNWAAGERGIAALPMRVSEFREGVGRALEYAKALDCKLLTALAGRAPMQRDPEAYEGTMVSNIEYAAKQAAAHGVTILVEALNRYDIQDSFLPDTAAVLRVLDKVNAPNVKMQYDIYHLQRAEGNLAATISEHIRDIAHFQLADAPARHEPGSGEINFNFLLDHIAGLGYDGWIGCEYEPAAGTEAGLAWAKKWLAN